MHRMIEYCLKCKNICTWSCCWGQQARPEKEYPPRSRGDDRSVIVPTIVGADRQQQLLRNNGQADVSKAVNAEHSISINFERKNRTK
jgi:hypothetical protein